MMTFSSFPGHDCHRFDILPDAVAGARVMARVWISLALLITVCWSGCGWADSHSAKLKNIKAAFVLNIAKFVSWPEEVYRQRPETLLICHYQNDFLGRGFESIRRRRVGGRRLLSQRRQSLSNSGDCDILLVPEQRLKRLGEEAAQGFVRPVLIIADLTLREAEGVAHPGIMLALVRDGARIGFEVNLRAVNRAGLQLSSQLLKLASIVHDNYMIEAYTEEPLMKDQSMRNSFSEQLMGSP